MIHKSLEHIILVMPGFAVDEQDTSCVPPVQKLALELSKNLGVDALTIVAMHYPYKSCSYKWNGINVIGIGANNVGFPRRLYFWRQFKKALSTILLEKKKVRVHSFWLSEIAYLAEKWANKNEVVHSVTLMGQEVKKGNRYISRASISEEKIISLSKFQSRIIEKNYQIKPVFNLCFGIDDEVIYNEEKSYDIIGVGSLVEIKNYDKFLKVIVEVKKILPQIKVGIVGGGNLSKIICDKAKALEVSEQIEFIGLLNREQSIAKIAQSKLLLHTSDFESLGYVFLEAIKQKVRIVSTPFGIAAENPDILKGMTVAELTKQVVVSLNQTSEIQYTKPATVEEVMNKYVQFWGNNIK
ncbi:MAG: glycosyltransferase involved in cell wall biosynthesis [Flavobacteriales bacterium]